MAAALRMTHDLPPLPGTADAASGTAEAESDATDLRAFVDRTDRAAFERLVRRHLDTCWRLARRLGGGAAEADDTVQEAVLAAMRGARSWRGGSVRAWLLGIVANVARSRVRRARRGRPLPHEPAAPEPGPDDAELRAAALAALAALPASYRDPVSLRYLDGFEVPEIAAALGLGERTTRTRLSRGIEKLRAALAPRRAMEASAVVALLPTVAEAAPPGCADATAATIATGPAAAAALPLLALALASGVLLVAATVAVAWAFSERPGGGRPDPEPRMAAGAAVPIEQLLDRRIDIAFFHHAHPTLPIQRALRDGLLPVSYPFTGIGLRWTGASVDGRNLRVREVLDRAATQLGLEWTVAGGYVQWFRPQADADRAFDLASLRDPARGMDIGPAETHRRVRLAAALRLAWSRDRAALRALLIASGGDDADAAGAAAQALALAYPLQWPSRRIGTPFHAFRGDAEVHAAADRAVVRLEDAAGAVAWRLAAVAGPAAHVRVADALVMAMRAHVAAPQDVAAAALTAALAVATGECGLDEVQRVALLGLVGTETPQPLRLACAHALARVGDERAIGLVRESWATIGSSRPHRETLVATTLEAYDACPGGGALVDDLVRIADLDRKAHPRAGSTVAAEALVHTRDHRAGAWAIRVLLGEPSDLAGHALGVLHMRPPIDLGPLVAAAADGDTARRVKAAAGRLQAGDRSAVALLEREAHDHGMMASIHLSDQAYPEAIEALRRLVGRAGPQRNPLSVLRTSRHPHAIAVLRAIAEDGIRSDVDRIAAARELVQCEDADALDAVEALPDPIRVAAGYPLRCPAYPHLLWANDQGLPSPRPSQHLDMPTRAEVALHAGRVPRMSDGRRASLIEAVTQLLLDDPSLPRQEFVALLRRLGVEDPVAAVAKEARRHLGRLETGGDALASPPPATPAPVAPPTAPADPPTGNPDPGF